MDRDNFKTICTLAWRQLHVTPIGVVKPCCIYDTAMKDEEGKPLLINDAPVEQIWNSSPFRDVRKKMLNGEKLPGCKKCYEEEKVSGTSDRTRSIDFSPTFIEMIQYSAANEGKVNAMPDILNLKIGNKCNLKCRMCQPLDSAMVDREFTEISHKHPLFRGFDNANAFDYNYDEVPIEMAGNWTSEQLAKGNILELLKNTKKISLAGGETTFTEEALELLKFCVDNDLAKNMNVVMSSNLTRITDDLIKTFAKFETFQIVASIDGVGPVNDYVRFPSKWSVIRENFKKLLDAPENVIPVVAPTIQIYNIFDVVNILGFSEEFDSPKWKLHPPCHLTVLYDPQHLSIRHLPISIKRKALAALEQFEIKSKYLKRSAIYYDQFRLLKETLAQDSFQAETRRSSKDYLSYFLQYTKLLDEQRFQRFQDFLPELYEALTHEDIEARYPIDTTRNYTFYRYRDSGFSFHKAGKIDEALKMFNEAYTLDPKDPHLNFSMALCLRSKGEFESAIHHFQLVDQVDPENMEVTQQIALIHMEMKNYAKALSCLEKVEKKGHAKPKLLLEMAHLQRKLNNSAKAMTYLLEVEKSDPKNVEVLLELGLVNLDLKNGSAAIKYFEKGLKLSTDPEKTKVFRDLLNSTQL